jgi:hypothetical protein
MNPFGSAPAQVHPGITVIALGVLSENESQRCERKLSPIRLDVPNAGALEKIAHAKTGVAAPIMMTSSMFKRLRGQFRRSCPRTMRRTQKLTSAVAIR